MRDQNQKLSVRTWDLARHAGSHFDFVRVSRTISWGYGKVGDEIVDIYFTLGDSPLRFHETAENIRTHRVAFVLYSYMEQNARN